MLSMRSQYQTEDYILYDLYEVSEQANLWRQKVNYWLLRAREWEKMKMTANEHQVSLQGDENVLKLTGDNCTTL